MAHEPKLEVFTIYLKSTTSEKRTFATYLEKAFKKTKGNPDYEKLYKSFFLFLLKQMDNTYHRDDKRKKAIGVKAKKRGEKLENTLSFASSQTIVEGTIKGGRYGQHRAIGDMEKPETDHAELDDKKIVLDDFYFLLYTPLGSTKLILMLQSYTDDTITDVFISFLRSALKTEGFYKPEIDTKCPDLIKEEFKKYSLVKEIRYRENIILNEVEGNSNIDTKEVVVEIKITAKNEGEKLPKFANLRRRLGLFSLKTSKSKGKSDTISLEEFQTKVGTLANGSHISSFVLDSDFDIKPRIYLQNHIQLQPDGTPEWESLKTYCKELLVEIKKEVYPENEIS